MFFGLALVVVGVIFLLQNLGYFSGDVWGYIWPVLVILFGISMLVKKDKGHLWHKCCKSEKEEK